ncbi:MAG: glucose 1-dehydrogenase [Pyrinomonadaceae bacterium]
MSNLQNKVAVITGGNSGIGLATAREFVNEGAKVVIFGRSQESLDRAIETLGSENALAVRGDVTSLADLENLFSIVGERFGKIDVLVANAGVANVRPLELVDEDHYDQVMNINVKGALFTVQKSLSALNDGASIVFTTSVVGSKGFPGMVVYAATKAALRSFVRTMSAELSGRKIRVNAVSPGPVATPIFGKMDLSETQAAEFGESLPNMVPLGRFGEPSEIAKTIAFLASDDSSFIQGSEISVDGGLGQV